MMLRTDPKYVTVNSFDELFQLTDEHKQSPTQQNIVLIVDDQWGLPRPFDSEGVKRFYASLAGQNELAKNGVVCDQYRTSATACVPARGVIYTGQYPSRTGLWQTDGGAKSVNDVRSLPLEIPTLGHYFKDHEVKYIGKNHLRHKDIVDEKGQVKISKPVGQVRDEKVTAEYLAKDPLAEIGFPGWVGPEPHGPAAENAGFNRDPEYVRQACEWLEQRNKSDTDKPFLLVVNLIGAHDIVYYSLLWMWYSLFYKMPSIDKSIGSIKLPPETPRSGNLAVHKAYTDSYTKMFCIKPLSGMNGLKIFDIYFQLLYWSLIKEADKNNKKIYDALKNTRFFNDTFLCKIADHGENRNAHRLPGKWLNAYDEALLGPCVISHPRLVNKGRVYNGLSSHEKIMPTLLKLAGIDSERRRLELKHSEAHPLVGIPIGDRDDYSAFKTAKKFESYKVIETSYFVTADNIINGGKGLSVIAQLYPSVQYISWLANVKPVIGNTYIEAVTARVKIDNATRLLKYALYQKPPENKEHLQPAKEHVLPGEDEELYDLVQDESENENLAQKDNETREFMHSLLVFERNRKLKPPHDLTILTRPDEIHHGKSPSPGNGFLVFLAAGPLLVGATAPVVIVNMLTAVTGISAAPLVGGMAAGVTLYKLYKHPEKIKEAFSSCFRKAKPT